MSLFRQLQKRQEDQRPIRVAVIGAGKFGTMFLAQALRLPGVHVVGIADLNVQVAKSNLALAGWPDEQYSASSLNAAIQSGQTYVVDDANLLIGAPVVDLVVECTGNPIVAVDHVMAAFRNGKPVVSATVEADALCGAALAQKAREHGVVYSMAYGDQPALVCELVDWARTCGFEVAAAGRGHKWKPEYRFSTPETVWDHWGLTPEQAERGRLNPKMFNSFLDGTKPAIESAAIANACGLDAPSEGLLFPSGSIDDLPNQMRPVQEGGVLEGHGMVEVQNCLDADGDQIGYDIRMGVFVCVKAVTDYQKHCLEEYKVRTDDSGIYMCAYKRWHLIGLELGMSVANVGLRGESTGTADSFRADVIAVAKRDLVPGEMLDGEGGYTVAGQLRPSAISVPAGLLPLGLAGGVKVLRPVKADQPLTYEDVEVDTSLTAYQLRRSAEAMLSV
ncbi:NAD(P)H-dependent oxidoreductase [Thalassococcus lentus]|uniref:SAF domain-containing protein n=1 Tax=Thalassococcus lentus TaxID=1210524 RepID=A0ABT4XP03_9RHOB|nr:SAF domain-containing protein [Thalassococcus lentus]MDA7423650.1 SAF domain-containing protein [Thalassococcus lentus]